MIEVSERGFRLAFENGYGISVINHERANCDESTAEIAILKGEHLTDPSVIKEKWGDQVKGWVTADEIASYINKVKSIES